MAGQENLSFRFKLKHSWWLLFCATVAFGFLALIYTGIKAKKRSWTLAGILYALPYSLYMLLSPNGSVNEDVLTGLGAVSFLCCLIHSFWIWPRYLEIMAQREQGKSKTLGQEEKKLEQ